MSVLQVELSISGDNAKTPQRTVLVERRNLPLPPLHMRMLDAGNGRMVAYLRLLYFTHEGTKEMASAIREGEALGVDGYGNSPALTMTIVDEVYFPFSAQFTAVRESCIFSVMKELHQSLLLQYHRCLC